MNRHIASSTCPPVNFIIDGKNSDILTWSRECSDVTIVTDYENTDPKERAFYTLTYTCAEYDIAVEVVITVYPNFPLIEYEATLINTAEGTSAEIKDLNSIDKNIYQTDKSVTLRYYTGSSTDGESDYNENIKIFSPDSSNDDNILSLAVTNGKPTSTYLPEFSIEQEGGDGVITLLSWQGCWKSEFTYDKSEGIHMTAGQNDTDFNLLEGETHRFPAVVLIFYKDSHVYGQNIYRRWFYQHNYMRENREKMGMNIALCVESLGEDLVYMQSNTLNDFLALDAVKTSGFNLFTHFHQDAGWFTYNERIHNPQKQRWYESVGNWDVDTNRYPNGLKEISDSAKELGLGYSLWIEPERAIVSTSFAAECSDYLLKFRENDGKVSANRIINLGNDEACQKVIDLVNSKIKESGATIYRQDFNEYPGPYWRQYDKSEAKKLGILRTGRTEEQYCNGYLKLLDGILEANDGIIIDTCASGGMRYDLATARRSYCLQLTDHNWGAEKNQSDTYVASKWMVCWGATFGSDQGNYGIRSKLALALTVGVPANWPGFDCESFFTRREELLTHHQELTSYMFEDYYPLTDYINGNELGVLAMQYDRPSTDDGMIIAYVRGTDISETLHPYSLDIDAMYAWYDADDEENVHYATGAELMDNGFTVISGTPENNTVEGNIVSVAKVFIYEKVN